MYTEFESRTLPGNIGYIRFNAFMPSLMKKVCSALRSHNNDAGLILDLRGNQGGLLGMIGGLTGLLEQKQVVMGLMQSRTGSAAVMAYPQRMPYQKPLVIMIDSATQSAAEMFASGLQESGRAILVGEKSAGNTLPSSIMKLPTGALFQFAFANYITPSGQSLEGRGITPDVLIELNRRNLLTGSDPQMAAALKAIRKQISPVKELIADVTVTTARPADEPDKPVPITPAAPPTVNGKPIPGRTIITVDAPPPVPKPNSGHVEVTVDPPAPAPAAAALPSVAEVIARYVTAVGGPAAFAKLKTRVSRGTVELQAMGLSGTTEIYEEAPAKSTMIINVDGLGTIQQTYDGTIAFLQDPLDGYVRFAPSVAAILRNDAMIDRPVRFLELNQILPVVSKGKVGDRDVFVLRSKSGLAQSWSFDTETGLLLRKGNSRYEDYREVDGVKLPFKVTDDTSYGFGVVVRLDEIKHNVPIDPSKFAEHADCFTQPEQNGPKR
jgi:hypothetical protein